MYFMTLFIAPNVAAKLGEILWLTEFNTLVIEKKDAFYQFITWYDMMEKYQDTKNDALEIKQNVSTQIQQTTTDIQTQVQDTKDKIENVQTKVEQTQQAIEQTTQSVNHTIDSLNELQQSIVDVIPWTASVQATGSLWTGETQ